MIQLYNTLTRKIEPFIPLDDGVVKIYTCGPTVYNYIHIGNARMVVVFDVLRRFLMKSGYEVRFVQNLTDVDDRIIEQAKKENKAEKEISELYATEFNRDLNSLNVLTPTIQPKVTEHMEEIIEFISKLIEKKMAYEENGNVWFRTASFEEYGKLSNQKLSELRAGDVEGGENKENPSDFALWKKEKPGEISWFSPFGKGRPGWHIECSAMGMKYLGEQFDIHGGGMDLCFPHHENEIAQTEALTNKQMANYWIHNNYVTVEGQKMSKSLGNFTTLRDALQTHSANTIRWFFLAVNYGNELDYSEIALRQAGLNFKKVETLRENMNFMAHNAPELAKQLISTEKRINDTRNKITQALSYNLDTSGALMELLEFTKQINKLVNRGQIGKQEAASVLTYLEEVFELLGFSVNQVPEPILNKEEIENMILKRDSLKKQAMNLTLKEEKIAMFRQSDQIRDYLKTKGVHLEDTPNGTRYKII